MDVARSALEHAERADPIINAFALLDRAGALAGARESEERWRQGAALGPLDGMPVAIKEFAAVRWPTRRGSALTSAEPAAAHTVFVQRLADAGAVLLGKTRAPEFNWKGITDSPAFGITRNPWNPSLTPGGSGGGCAAAVAAGVVRLSMGSDAGGSIRIPAAFTGTIGLKPTHGRIPCRPCPAPSRTSCTPAPSPPAWTSCGKPIWPRAAPRRWTGPPTWARTAAPTPPRAPHRPAVAPALGPAQLVPVRAALDETLAALRADGFDVTEVDYDIEAASQVGQDLYRLGCAAAVRAIAPEQHGRLDPGLLAFVQGVDDWPISRYHAICQQRDRHANELAALHARVDLLLLPTVPLCAFEAGRDVPQDQPGADWMSWNPARVQQRAGSGPVLSGLGAGRRAAGRRAMGRAKYREDRLLAMGRWMETRFPVRIAPEQE